MWVDLFKLCDGHVGNIYEWPAYDTWAQKWGLVAQPDFRDWLRVVAWSLRRPRWSTKGEKLPPRLPETFHWEAGIKDEVDRSRAGLRRHRRDGIAVEGFVRWQLCNQDWPEIRTALHLPQRQSLSNLRDLVFRAATTLSFTPRRGKAGRRTHPGKLRPPKQRVGRPRAPKTAREPRARAPQPRQPRKQAPPTSGQVEWARPRVPALCDVILLIGRVPWKTHEREFRAALAEWTGTSNFAAVLADLARRKRLKESPSRILSRIVGRHFHRGRRFGHAVVVALKPKTT